MQPRGNRRVRLRVGVAPERLAALRRIAQAEDLPVAAVARRAITEYLARQEQRPGAAR
ncbi:MAG TPA: hypothetical protein VFA44_02890 [Gaiellaceae bacterium]|nr:hypothetical protein [Gaiellaceae bacterium]